MKNRRYCIPLAIFYVSRLPRARPEGSSWESFRAAPVVMSTTALASWLRSRGRFGMKRLPFWSMVTLPTGRGHVTVNTRERTGAAS